METTGRVRATTRAPMDSMRKTALVAGVLYLLTFAASIPAVFLMGPVLTNPDYILGAGADRQVILGAFLDIITALAGIGTAVALFSVVKRQHEGLAIGFVASRGFEAAVIAVPHDKWVERPLACVVPKPEWKGRLTKQEILDYLAPRVAKWWLPDDVAFIEAVPKTSVGKFDKKVLRERFKGWKAPA